MGKYEYKQMALPEYWIERMLALSVHTERKACSREGWRSKVSEGLRRPSSRSVATRARRASYRSEEAA